MSTTNVLASSTSARATNPAVMFGGVMPPNGLVESEPTFATPQPASRADMILMGIDERRRPHASRFDAVDHDTITTAAETMGFTTLLVTSEAMADLAAKLPSGKLFASGKAFVPFVNQQLFDRLVAYLPISARPLTPAASKKAMAGSAVLSSVEAASTPDGNSDTALVSNAYAAVKEGSARPRSGMFPENWEKIRVGQIVLASTDRDEGWWTAHVREDKGDDVFVLEWEGWEGELFIRRRNQVALLHPAYDGK